MAIPNLQANLPSTHHGRVKVDIQRLQAASDYIKFVNSLNLNDIVFVGDNTSDFVPTKEAVHDWKFIGLSNVWFAKEYGIINE